MRFLIDVNVERAIGSWLEQQGHDVEQVVPKEEAETDAQLLEASVEAQQILISRDRPFGALVFRQRRQAYGVVYLRLYHDRMEEQVSCLAGHWAIVVAALPGNFITVLADGIRTRRLPA
ncbi:MAG: DUF5615 family PIN-like protein [Phycisphaerae bacterium]